MSNTEIGPCGKHLKMFMETPKEAWDRASATGKDANGVDQGDYSGKCKLCREIEQAVEAAEKIAYCEGMGEGARIGGDETIARLCKEAVEREVAGAYEAAANKIEPHHSRNHPSQSGQDYDLGFYDAREACAAEIRSLDSSAAQRGKQRIREEALREMLPIANSFDNIEIRDWLRDQIRKLIDKPGGSL